MPLPKYELPRRERCEERLDMVATPKLRFESTIDREDKPVRAWVYATKFLINKCKISHDSDPNVVKLATAARALSKTTQRLTPNKLTVPFALQIRTRRTTVRNQSRSVEAVSSLAALRRKLSVPCRRNRTSWLVC